MHNTSLVASKEQHADEQVKKVRIILTVTSSSSLLTMIYDLESEVEFYYELGQHKDKTWLKFLKCYVSNQFLHSICVCMCACACFLCVCACVCICLCVRVSV